MLRSEVRSQVGGWTCIEFADMVGVPCSIHASGSYVGPALVLGRGYAEMALDQATVRELLPLLTRFVETGDIES